MNTYHHIILLLVFIYVINTNGSFFKKQDKIHSTIGYLRSCGTEQDNRLNLHLSTRKYNRTHLATSMNITIYEPFGEEYVIDMELMLWSDGGWKRNFFNYKRSNACDALYKILGPVWVDIITTAGAPNDCPLQAGYYKFDDHYIDLSPLPFVSMPGKFLMLATVFKKGVKQACIEIEMELKVMFGMF